MVTEKQEVPAVESDIEIVDTTPPEVDAAIDSAAAQAKGETPAPSASESSPSPTPVAPPAEPVKAPEPVQPPKRTYSEDEWSKMRQAEARRQNELARQVAALKEQTEQAQMEAQVEGYRRAAIVELQSKGFDQPTAEAHANQVAADRRQALTYQRQVQALQQQQQATVWESENAAKVSLAQLEARDNGLDQQDIQVLLTVNDPVAMQSLAKTLGQAKKAIQSAEKAKQATVPPVRVESGNSAAAPADAMEAVYNRIESGNATEDDWRAYRRANPN